MALVEELMNGSKTTDSVQSQECFRKLKDTFVSYLESLKGKRTCDLSMQYLSMVEILLKFLKAERTGNVLLHLDSLSCMMPYFAASGHNNCMKSAAVYFKNMRELQDSNSQVFQDFIKGLYTIRRSNRFWAGLSPDLAIEQVLMRSIKTNGGLTRRKGFGELQRTVWTLAMPACASINLAIQNLTRVSYNTSDQHREASESRKARDAKDSQVSQVPGRNKSV